MARLRRHLTHSAPALAAVVLSGALCMACGAHASSGGPASGGARNGCVPGPGISCRSTVGGWGRERYVTWGEYYTDVMEEAFRRNSSVIWINPPTPIRKQAIPQGAPVAGLTP